MVPLLIKQNKVFITLYFIHSLCYVYRLDDNISDNTILKLSLDYPYGDIYEVLCTDDNANEDLQLPLEQLSKDMVFNVLFMSCYHGNADFCATLLSTEGMIALLFSIGEVTLL